MDSVFTLRSEARSSFLVGVARILGCVYICLWSYIPHPANCLVSMDGCFNEGDQNKQPEAGTSSSSAPRNRLFDQYRRSFCSVESGCVPGLAYRDGLDYMEVEESRLATSAATQSQRQFYREAGIKTAIFMGCRSGEIELGFRTPSNMDVQMGIRSMFSEQVMQLHYSDQHESRPSSTTSSSSLRSVSVGSPEYCSLVVTKAGTTSACSAVDTTISTEAASTNIDIIQQAPTSTHPIYPAIPTPATLNPAPPEVVSTILQQQAHHHYGAQLARSCSSGRLIPSTPAGAADDAAIASAMLAVISASTSHPSPTSSVQYPSAPSTSHGGQLQLARQVIMEGGRRGRAFRSYSRPAPLAPIGVEPIRQHSSHVGGQRMIKTAHAILRQLTISMSSGVYPRVPTSNQLHHMIAERKRREKLNESFAALRMLLPQGTKKDKASVLTKAKEYLNILKAQISDLEEKNRLMTEARLSAAEEAPCTPAHAGERVRVQVWRSPVASSSSETVRIELRVTVWAECATLDLVIPVLECLKAMGNASVASLEAAADSQPSQPMNPLRRATFSLQIERGGWDERGFKAAIARAVDEALPPQTAPAAAP